MKSHYTITDEDGVVRVDKFLAVLHPEYSRAALAKLFTLNLIKLHGETIQPGHKLRPGATFEYDLGPLQQKPEVIALPIIYEDDNVVVVDKPAGIISHARGKFWQEASVASFIRDRISGMSGERGGIVHRLDRATSGVMVCAKNEATLSFLQKQFSERRVEKTYVAIVTGSLPNEEAIIDAPIGRSLTTPKKFEVNENGRSAQTHYRIDARHGSYSRVELKPKTGRTHQLRVHLASLGAPIVGDELYGGETAPRLLLHAHTLSIVLPDQEQVTFSSALPTEFFDYVPK